MPIILEREPIDCDVFDADATRAWLMEQVREEIKLLGQPHPRVYLLADGHAETLDLDAMARGDKQAHPGATFQSLRERPDIHRRFALMQMHAEDSPTSADRHFALLFEEIDEIDDRRWWVATLEYEVAPDSGLGIPQAEWLASNGETRSLDDLWPFLRELAVPPEGSRAAKWLPPRQQQPEIQAAFGDLHDQAPVPASVAEMVDFAASLAVGDLLTGRVKGNVVVRIAGRSWEEWVLGDHQPAPLEDMIRTIANKQGEPAEGVALVQVAIRPQDEPPIPGVQVLAEWGGMVAETWSPLEFPDGPRGPKRIPQTFHREPRPVGANGLWIGVDPMVQFHLGPMSAAD